MMRKAEILVAAKQLFEHYGFTKTTVADIAREAGLGVGTVYLEFQSKDSISGALCKTHRETILGAMRDVIESDGNFSERLVQVLEVRHKGVQETVRGGIHGEDILFASCPTTKDVNHEFAQAEEELLGEFLLAGNRAGAFSVSDVPTTARIILKIYDAVSPPGEQESLATLHALILGGVLSRHGH